MYRTLYSPQGGRIILDGREVINMASNNYLGLANHPAVVAAAKEALEKYGVATTASRNICGNYPVHDELEEKLAKFKGVEATLVFNCGVTANSGLIPQLVGKGDFIYSDELNHGSIIDGCRLSGAKIKVFRHMDIATAKPTAEELALVPHHLVDILEPDAKFSVVDFQQQADRLIREINSRGKIPILVGGTGLYVKALLEAYDFSHVDESAALRRQLEEFADREGNQALHDRLAALDPVKAGELKINDRRRIIRAIETIRGGESVSAAKAAESPYHAVVFGLTMPRDSLYERINRRVDLMVEQGLFAETRKLIAMGVPETAQSMKSIGYRQVLQYFHGEWTKEEAIAKLKQATRNFAKRQITWYKKMPYIQWFQLDDPPDYRKCVAAMLDSLAEKKFIPQQDS